MNHVHSAILCAWVRFWWDRFLEGNLQSFDLPKWTSTFFKDLEVTWQFSLFWLPRAATRCRTRDWRRMAWRSSGRFILLSFWTSGDWERSLLMTRARLGVSSERKRPVVTYGLWLAEQIFTQLRTLFFMAYWTWGSGFRKGEDLRRYSSTLWLTFL